MKKSKRVKIWWEYSKHFLSAFWNYAYLSVMRLKII